MLKSEIRIGQGNKEQSKGKERSGKHRAVKEKSDQIKQIRRETG